MNENVQDHINDSFEKRVTDLEGHASIANREMGEMVTRVGNMERWLSSLDAKVWWLIAGILSTLVGVLGIIIEIYLTKHG